MDLKWPQDADEFSCFQISGGILIFFTIFSVFGGCHLIKIDGRSFLFYFPDVHNENSTHFSLVVILKRNEMFARY